MSGESPLSRRQLAACFSALGLLLILVAFGSASALAEGQGSPEPPLPSPDEVIQAIEADPSGSLQLHPTDSEAAGELPHRDLGRSEAADLLQSVFGVQLQAPASIFDELEVERFLAPDVAVLASQEPPESVAAMQPEPSGLEVDESESTVETEKESLRAQSPLAGESDNAITPEGEAQGQLRGGTLLDSSVPLRTESSSGGLETVDLSLEYDEGEIQPTAPLVEVGIPAELGEGIELPEAGVTIELAGAPDERMASLIDQSVAFVPNVATDTDLAIAPTPIGVETLTQLRSPDAPLSQTFNLDIPPDAILEPTEDGGAAVKEDDEILVSVGAPTALDATGASVPVNLEVDGDSLTLNTSPGESTNFPVLVDPLFQTYEWSTATYYKSGICNSSFKTEISTSCMTREEWGYEHSETQYYSPPHIRLENRYGGYGTPGLFIETNHDLGAGSKGSMIYTVPRYFTDYGKYGSRPTSFISNMTLWNLQWRALSSSSSPYLFAGLWDSVKPGWVSYFSHEGLNGHSLSDMAWLYKFTNSQPNTNAKVGYVSVQATATGPNQNTDVYVGSAKVELSDKDIPGFGSLSGPSQWLNQTVVPISFTASDSGLGVQSITLTDAAPTPHSWKTSYGCIGVSGSACPRTWGSTDVGPPVLKYEPALMPQGIGYLSAVAEDPVGNKSAAGAVQIKVDHTAPGIALAGTMTEQATLGTKRPIYTLKAETTDGTTEQPQSGVTKVSIEFDGKVVAKTEPGCPTKNCAVPLEWSLESSSYAAGQHTAKVTATDAVGLTTTKTLTVNLQPSPPSLSLSGTMTEQVTLGTSRPRYKLKVNASAQAGIEGISSEAPQFASAFGSSGTGDSQFAHPSDAALDAKGNLWVVDQDNDRVQQFNANGEFLAKFGSSGSANGQFQRPTALAIDAKGNIWVTDAAGNRIQQFNEKGEFVRTVGTYGAGNGQFSGPEGIAIDPKGNLWVSDTYNSRLQKFNENGEFIKVVGTKGSAAGQLIEPTGIDVGPGGNVWVTDWANNRVEVYTEAGEYVRQFGSQGSGNGQFQRPDALAIDSKGNVWVGDQNNDRVQQFNQNGEYVAQFGSPGSDDGQFNFSWPMGIAADSRGSLWVTDTVNNRMQKWLAPGYAPVYSSSFGSSGSAAGQLSSPSDVAIDDQGNIWVADMDNSRVQKFNSKGEFLSQFGSYGSGDGQLSSPTSLAIDAKGNIWVTDADNNRVQQFNEKGQFLAKFGVAGFGNGKLFYPMGIAIDAAGRIWVSDYIKVQRFTPTGEFVSRIATGTGAGQLSEPRGIDISSAGEVFIADSANHRISVFNEAGGFIRQFGSQGSGNGQFKYPAAVEVDHGGDVWVGDTQNHRVQLLTASGSYVTQFGSQGSGAGQFNLVSPMGVAVTEAGRIWITDVGNHHIQRWSQSSWRSEIATEVLIDGSPVNFGEAGCTTEQCSITQELTLDASTYSSGQHTIVAKATDGLGNKTTKTLVVEVQPDTTKPALESSGELVDAPEGWVEQESYGLNATATDDGHGVTSLSLRIDGQEVATVNQTCLDGGCPATLSKSIDMGFYSGGAHPTELVATDGAGNVTTKHWTLNVDPEGHISATEAAETLDAVDATSNSTIVAPTVEVIEPGQIEAGNNPSLEQTESEISSTGSPTHTTMGIDPADGFTMQFPDGTAEIDPVVSGASSDIEIAEEVAGVAANAAAEVDTVIRPEYNGVQTFQAIRSAESTNTFSWIVNLSEGQTLRLVDDTQAEVVYENGTRAFLITAEEAHDAIGTKVPTSIAVAGNQLTLTVAIHSGSFVYPIIAGQGWEGGYVAPIVIEIPEDETEEKERIEAEKKLEAEMLANESIPQPSPPGSGFPASVARILSRPSGDGRLFVPAPAYPPSGGASISRIRRFDVDLEICGWPNCDDAAWDATLEAGPFERGPDWSSWASQWTTHCHTDIRGWYETLHVAWSDIEAAGTHTPNTVRKGEGKHLTAWCRFEISILVPEVGDLTDYYYFMGWVWPNGYQEAVVQDYDPPIIEN